MRDQEEIETAKQALENRLEEYREVHPLLLAFNAPKRDIMAALLDGDDPEYIESEMAKQLRKDLDLSSFIQVQAARNAASWAMGDLDSI